MHIKLTLYELPVGLKVICSNPILQLSCILNVEMFGVVFVLRSCNICEVFQVFKGCRSLRRRKEPHVYQALGRPSKASRQYTGVWKRTDELRSRSASSYAHSEARRSGTMTFRSVLWFFQSEGRPGGSVLSLSLLHLRSFFFFCYYFSSFHHICVGFLGNFRVL